MTLRFDPFAAATYGNVAQSFATAESLDVDVEAPYGLEVEIEAHNIEAEMEEA